MDNKLSQQIENALAENNGILHEANFVAMTVEVYRDAFGNMSNQELQESLAKINAAEADIDEGRTRPFKDAINQLGNVQS